MSYVTTRDGADIYYQDRGAGLPVVFSHGWPLDADAWDAQMRALQEQGYRVIAHDRRGHGRSSQPAGHDLDTYADDLAAVLDALDLKDVTLVGHSIGAGEVTRYVGRYGTRRIAKVVLLAAVPPVLLDKAALPRSVPDACRYSAAQDRAQFFRELALHFYGYNRPGVQPDPHVVDAFLAMALRGDPRAGQAFIQVFSNTDLSEDLRKFNVPSLIIHGADDQIVPLAAAMRAPKLMARNAVLKIYPGAPHGLCTTLAATVSAYLLAFLAD
jgi:non-heme chloroperoxidase